MKKFIVIIAIIFASVAAAFGQKYEISNLIGQVVSIQNGIYDGEKVFLSLGIEDGVYFVKQYSEDGEEGVPVKVSYDKDKYIEQECWKGTLKLMNEIQTRTWRTINETVPSLKEITYNDFSFQFGDYHFIEVDLLGSVELEYKKVYAYTCDYKESVELMNALNNKKGCNSNITYVVSRKSWGDGDYDVRVTVTFKDKRAEYVSERNQRMSSVK